jgi:alpha-1,2-mannosyltransferase
MHRALEMLRSGDWLTRERVRFAAAAIVVASLIGILSLVVTAHGAVDRLGRPLGTDFSSFYAAGTYVQDGDPTAPFDFVRQHAREQQMFGAATPFYSWFYPPVFLFIAAGLAKLPYIAALAVWQGITFALYFLAIRAIMLSSAAPPSDGIRNAGDSLWIPLAVAFPAVLVNLGHGQNGFLTAALLGGALVALERRPITAGILFGMLVYKPQLGLMLPIALAAGGYWRSIAASMATVVVLTGAATLAFGPQTWAAFFHSTSFARAALESGAIDWYKLQSVFAWARLWGAPIPLAYLLQGAATIGVGAALAWLWRGNAPFSIKAAALCLGAVLATAFVLDYDLLILAPAIAFVAIDGRGRGFLPWEKTALAALWLAPLVGRGLAQATLIPVGVPTMAAAFILLLRRAELDRSLPMAFAASSSTMAAAGKPRGHDIAAFEQ